MKLKGLMFYLLTEFGKQIQFPCSSLYAHAFPRCLLLHPYNVITVALFWDVYPWVYRRCPSCQWWYQLGVLPGPTHRAGW